MVVRLAKWLEDYFVEVATAVGGIFLAYGGLAGLNPWEEGLLEFASWAGAMFLLGSVLVFCGTIAGIKRARAARPLQKKLERFEGILEQMVGVHYDLCSTTLARILRDTFRYGDSERISVYRHRGENAFQIMGRHSENPVYKQRGRPIYPADQGVLGYAWRHKTATAELPDPEEHLDQYYQVLEEEWGISRQVAENFTMKSRSLVACAVYEPKNIDPVAVVVVESTKVGILEKDVVVPAIMEGKDGDIIYDFFEMMQPLEPDLAYTREQGL
jgi:hypothetical protein